MYGGLRVADGQTVTCTAPSRNSVHYQRFLSLVEQANPTGEVVVITDNLSSHTSVATREWLAGHPRLRHGCDSLSWPHRDGLKWPHLAGRVEVVVTA